MDENESLMSFSIGVEFDRAIDWRKRLGLEIPFLRAWLRSWNAKQVADLACGSGRHCLALADQGFTMTGVDEDPSMLALAEALLAERRSRSGSNQDCRFLRGDLRRLELPRQDAILCLGNSLSLLEGPDEVQSVLQGFHDTLRTRAGVILHVLNYRRFAQPGRAFFPLKTDLEDGLPRRHYLKMIQCQETTAQVHLVLIEEESGTWVRRVKSERLALLEPQTLQEMLRRAGFREIQIYGSLRGEHYDEDSPDVVVCARRG
jgi:SAM-dependent methyltransferase